MMSELRLFGLALAFAGLFAACGPHPPISPAPNPSSTTITLAMSSPPGDSSYHYAVIPISIGHGSRISDVMLDTGSPGLRITLAALEASNATYFATGKNTSTTFADNNGNCTWAGFSAIGDIYVGGILIRHQFFDVVTSITACNDLGALSGIMGVRPALVKSTDDARVGNLMMLLPGNFGTGYVASLYASPPTLTVGLTPSLKQGFVTVSPSPEIATVPPYFTYWGPPNQSSFMDDEGTLPWCVTLTAPPGTVGPQPQPTATCTSFVVTDSGGNNGRIYLDETPPPWFPTPQPAGYAVAPAGAQIALSIGTSSWTLPAAGTCSDYNTIPIYFGNGPTEPFEDNTGISPFMEYDIMYDFADEQFGVHAATKAAPAFC
jgi:hypothetical protein